MTPWLSPWHSCPQAIIPAPHTHFLLTSIIPVSHLTGFIISSGVPVILSICVKPANACKRVGERRCSKSSFTDGDFHLHSVLNHFVLLIVDCFHVFPPWPPSSAESSWAITHWPPCPPWSISSGWSPISLNHLLPSSYSTDHACSKNRSHFHSPRNIPPQPSPSAIAARSPHPLDYLLSKSKPCPLPVPVLVHHLTSSLLHLKPHLQPPSPIA